MKFKVLHIKFIAFKTLCSPLGLHEDLLRQTGRNVQALKGTREGESNRGVSD